MSKFVVEIRTDNDAFVGESGSQEVARILAGLSEVLDNFGASWDAGPLFDVNGNRVGFYAWEGD
jgi:hypothetical protein